MRLKIQALMVALCCFGIAMLVSPSADATIVHHCDYTPAPSGPDNDPHQQHGDTSCNNTDPSGNEHPGECETQTGFFNTTLNCTGTSCTITGTIYCGPMNNKSYQITCSGSSSGAWGIGAKTFASCSNGSGSSTSLVTCD